MKKILVLLAVAAALAAVVALLVSRGGGAGLTDQAPAGLADVETALFLELGDLPGSARRWQGTALAAIATEPDVQAFLDKPLAKLRESLAQSPFLEPLAALDAAAAFIAVSDISRPTPTVLAGFSHKADKAALDAALAPARDWVKNKHPDGKADLVEVAGQQVEVWRTDTWQLASTSLNGWYLIANDIDALTRALARLRKANDAPPALASSEKFRSVLSRLPETRESLVYADAPPLVARLIELMTASGQSLDRRQVEDMRRLSAVGATTTFEGADIRDASFIQMDMSELPVGRLSGDYPLTSADTLFHYAGLLVLPETFQIPDPAAAAAATPLAILSSLLDQLEAKGLGAEAFAKAFGPGFSLGMDWPQGALQPQFAMAADVADRPTAQKILDELASGSLGLPVFAREQTRDGAVLYTLPPLPRVMLSPSLGLSDERLVLALSPDITRRLLAAGGTPAATLADSPAFQQAMAKVSTPTHATGYLDTRPVFQRTYDMLRPTLVFAAALMPGVNESVDLSKLPPTEAIARHLSPIVFSQSHHADGVFYESVGPITMTQGLFTGGAAAAVGVAWSQGLMDALKPRRSP